MQPMKNENIPFRSLLNVCQCFVLKTELSLFQQFVQSARVLHWCWCTFEFSNLSDDQIHHLTVTIEQTPLNQTCLLTLSTWMQKELVTERVIGPQTCDPYLIVH